MNYPEQVWRELQRAEFPLSTGEDERRLKIAFLQGMHTAQRLVVDSTQLSNDDVVKFNAELQKQIAGSLAILGRRPGNVRMGKKPI